MDIEFGQARILSIDPTEILTIQSSDGTVTGAIASVNETEEFVITSSGNKINRISFDKILSITFPASNSNFIIANSPKFFLGGLANAVQLAVEVSQPSSTSPSPPKPVTYYMNGIEVQRIPKSSQS